MRSGGSYDNRDGKMKRVAGTDPHPDGNRPRNAKGEPTDLPAGLQQARTPAPKARKKVESKKS
ncbi:MAG: hypothetical protein KZQ99_04445 [Candidatus Thiodiazotropha sp. (ex Dulcina madagascariensis)]|nr:hypothetical protein [Candidatus Thiodiazotropha sp. (ex Dulcina madagascariensis)]